MQHTVHDELDSAPLFNTAAVAQRSGVPVGTFHAWERRYGFPAPHRDEVGQRLYSERDVQAIRWLQEQTRQGVAVRRAVEMLRQGYADLRRPVPRLEGVAELQSGLLEALVGFNPARAHALLGETFALFSVEDGCLRVLEPVLVEIGARWEAGELCVAEEHYASTFLRERIASMLQTFGGGRGMPLVMTGCAPDEHHELGALMVSLFLARAGFAVHYLGPNVPADSLTPALERLRPQMLILSARSPRSAQGLVAVEQTLAALGPMRPRLAFGGGIFKEQPELLQAVPGIYLGDDARAAVEMVDEILETAAPSISRRN